MIIKNTKQSFFWDQEVLLMRESSALCIFGMLTQETSRSYREAIQVALMDNVSGNLGKITHPESYLDA